MSRQENNRILVFELLKLIDKHPELRFSQILVGFGFVSDMRYDGNWIDEFYVEPEDILRRVMETQSNIKIENE